MTSFNLKDLRSGFFSSIRWLNDGLLRFCYRIHSPVVFGGPSSLMVEPTAKCNFRCPFCPTGRGISVRGPEVLTFDTFRRVLGMCRYTIRTVSFWNYGESLINRELGAMIRFASSYYMQTQLSTNGSLLSGQRLHEVLTSGLSRLIISIDTPNPEVYGRYRIGGSFAKLMGNIKEAVSQRNNLKSGTRIIAQYMIMKDNEDVSRMLEHAKSLGVDYAMIKTIGIGSSVQWPTSSEWSLLPVNEEYHRYVSRDDFRSKITWADTGERCAVIWEMMVLNSDAICVPCCRDQNTEFPLGSALAKGSLLRVWNSKEYRNYRRQIMKTQRSATMCIRCGDVVRERIEPGLFKIDGTGQQSRSNEV